MVSPPLLDALTHQRALAIVRGRDRDGSLAAVQALVEEGIRIVEVSLTGVDALSVLRQAADKLDPSAMLGAGTLRTVTQLDAALEAGATFIVSPALTAGAIEAIRRGIPTLPGVFTPTELEHALELGATAVKLFPASLGGPGYLRALREPYPDAQIVAVGGVQLDVVDAYFESGALAVGLGGPLLGDAPHGGDLTALRQRARALVAQIGAPAPPPRSAQEAAGRRS